MMIVILHTHAVITWLLQEGLLSGVEWDWPQGYGSPPPNVQACIGYRITGDRRQQNSEGAGWEHVHVVIANAAG